MATNGSDDLSGLTAALAPDFTLQREIGRGGMGVVYLALDVKLDRPVAIKVLPASLAQSAGVRDRFLREGRTAAKLSHPNIVPIYRADEIDGTAFLVMGFVDGPSLGERLSVSGTIPPAETARILGDVASALDYAHARGVIHRDVKPENVLLERASGRALMTDFGIAHVAAATPLTQTGQVLGSVHYMSPEQVSGEPMDGRSDLYAVGVMGFRMLTGRLPFDNPVASAVMVAHVTRPAPPLRDLAPHVPPVLAEVIDRCLRKSPVDRYASGSALAAALGAALAACDDWVPASTVSEASTSPPAGPDRLSGREKDAVLALAAQLQDATSSRPVVRPLSPLAARGGTPTDATDERSATQGYPLAHVAAAAEEVGIDSRYVAQAVSELGLASRATGRPIGGRASLAPPRISTLPTRRFLGLPIGLAQTLELGRPLSDREWARLVADLRETFNAAGSVKHTGPFREWSNGNLRALVEPAENGDRVRLQTVNGSARPRIVAGLGMLGLAAAIAIETAGTYSATHFAVMGSSFMGVVAVGMFGIGALRLPGWARRRRTQFDEVLARVAAASQEAARVESGAIGGALPSPGTSAGRRA